MSNPSYVTLQLAASSATAICASQTPGAAGALTINGSAASGGVATLDVGRRVAIASAANDAGHTFTITGTNNSGAVISEVLTGPNTTSVNSVLDYKTVTSIVISAAAAGAITVGTSGVGSSVWVYDNFLAPFWALAGGITGPSGTTYSLEVTYDDPNAGANSGVAGIEQWSMGAGSFSPPHVWAFPTIIGASGDNQFSFPNQPIMAHRLTILSGTGLVTMQSIQAGIGSA